MQGSLFTQDFLDQGIAETEAWQTLGDAEVDAFREYIAGIFQAFPVDGNPNEAQTERHLIDPLLGALGWADFLPQQAAPGQNRHTRLSTLRRHGRAPDGRARAARRAPILPRDRHPGGQALGPPA